MSYYRVCEFCGDLLDPGERCECRKEEEMVLRTPRKIEYPKEMKRRCQQNVLCSIAGMNG